MTTGELQRNLEAMTENYYTRIWCIVTNDSCLEADTGKNPNCKTCNIAITHLKRILEEA